MTEPTLNPDNLTRRIEIGIANALNPALGELPGHWLVRRMRWLSYGDRRRVAATLIDAIWPHIMDAVLDIARFVIDDPGEPMGVVEIATEGEG